MFFLKTKRLPNSQLLKIYLNRLVVKCLECAILALWERNGVVSKQLWIDSLWFHYHFRGQRRYHLPSFPSRRWSETPGQKRSLRTPQGRRARSCLASLGLSLNGYRPAGGCVSGARWKDACLVSWAGWSPSTVKWHHIPINKQLIQGIIPYRRGYRRNQVMKMF